MVSPLDEIDFEAKLIEIKHHLIKRKEPLNNKSFNSRRKEETCTSVRNLQTQHHTVMF